MATPFVRGMTFTSRVATADINSLTFQRRAEIPKSVMSKPFVRGYGEGGNPAYPNCFSIPLNPPFRPLSLFEYFPQKGKEKESLFIGEACVLSCLLQTIRYVAITKVSPLGRFRGAIPTASGGLTGEGGNPAYPNRFQSPLIPLF